MVAELNSGQKWTLAIFIGFFFLIISSSVFYCFTNRITTGIGLPPTMSTKGPTLFGLLLSTFIFVILIKIIILG